MHRWLVQHDWTNMIVVACLKLASRLLSSHVWQISSVSRLMTPRIALQGLWNVSRELASAKSA